ncbi:glycoside hydrolase family 15 protein [Actinoplanes teichomyceticus]|uniref:Glucoamylase n=1 Tax=Actinoplanes teichomyceticus TaxID=1867 RepID=A0A561WKX2_ACTTI|nr:glycoside hydrolase family 15 protein [Actinoplanes teichomyceticus]TWG24493.1 glucoamylase [Actinoplanes teichomyceticus]GIF17236.1 glucan 1,4-alpha-glucosidase [Actinoplanes teichomyceticus]
MTYRKIGRVLAAALLGLTPVAAATGDGEAPGAPGLDQQFLPADKGGLITATGTASRVWATVQRTGGLGEIFYPDLGTPSVRALDFVVAGPDGRAARAVGAVTSLIDRRSLSFEQRLTDPAGRWRLALRYVTDPHRATVLVDVRFTAGPGHRLYAVYDPALANSRGGDAGRTDGDALLASDGGVASAFVASPGFRATSSGFAGVSDGWTDLLADGRMDRRHRRAAAGNLVQTGELRGRHTTLALGFGPSTRAALSGARAGLRRGFGALAREYAAGWHRHLAGLRRPPAVADRTLWQVSAMVLAASEDKTHRGAYVAAPGSPWAFGRDDPSGPYHLVWSRDLYQIATGLLAAGDRAGAQRALDHLFTVQQRSDGSFPQNARPDGTPVWTGLQLDQVGLPIVLAYQLDRTDVATWRHVRRAADFLVGFEQDGNRAPWSPQDRWENQSGYSPATIAAQIAGLVCAASIARANGDVDAAGRYLRTADSWRARVKAWTVTGTGPYSAEPYFLRLTKDGQPDRGSRYDIGDSGPSGVDQRRVVDPGFLELVRLGVLAAGDPVVRNSLRVVDAQLAAGPYGHRASFDGYGEKADGSPWDYPLPADSRITRGRAWPLLNGERGEYLIAAGDRAAAGRQLALLAGTATGGRMLPEQVWDQYPPNRPLGTPSTSAMPLAWTHAQYLRLAADLAAGRLLEQPRAVADRYLR